MGVLRSAVPIKGTITLPVVAGKVPLCFQVSYFTVIKIPSTYNVIFNRPGMNDVRTIVSTYYLLMKFFMLQRIGEVRGN